MDTTCPNCERDSLQGFYHVSGVPVHTVLLMPSRDEAIHYPRGDIELGWCTTCGFISNVAFDKRLLSYSSRYEETQSCSETFGDFHRSLCDRLIKRYQLRAKRIIEIGSGKGEFISQLCERGENSGMAFDPAYVEGRVSKDAAKHVTFVTDFYSERYGRLQADLILCKMTLEHIPDTGTFIKMLRRNIHSQDTGVFFQVPDATRILNAGAFWDIYYEHCAYFTPDSLAHVFQQSGFDVEDVYRDYDGQYLMIHARPARRQIGELFCPVASIDMKAAIDLFISHVKRARATWRNRIAEKYGQDRRIALWGGGSKAVAFVNTLSLNEEIEQIVDINPHKHGTFLPGTGHPIVPPKALQEARPDLIIIMNPVYQQEINQALTELGVKAELAVLH